MGVIRAYTIRSWKFIVAWELSEKVTIYPSSFDQQRQTSKYVDTHLAK